MPLRMTGLAVSRKHFQCHTTLGRKKSFFKKNSKFTQKNGYNTEVTKILFFLSQAFLLVCIFLDQEEKFILNDVHPLRSDLISSCTIERNYCVEMSENLLWLTLLPSSREKKREGRKKNWQMIPNSSEFIGTLLFIKKWETIYSFTKKLHYEDSMAF